MECRSSGRRTGSESSGRRIERRDRLEDEIDHVDHRTLESVIYNLKHKPSYNKVTLFMVYKTIQDLS